MSRFACSFFLLLEFAEAGVNFGGGDLFRGRTGEAEFADG
jgi:hypothetical protein